MSCTLKLVLHTGITFCSNITLTGVCMLTKKSNFLCETFYVTFFNFFLVYQFLAPFYIFALHSFCYRVFSPLPSKLYLNSPSLQVRKWITARPACAVSRPSRVPFNSTLELARWTRSSTQTTDHRPIFQVGFLFFFVVEIFSGLQQFLVLEIFRIKTWICVFWFKILDF